jgi:hypothetical protein
MKRRFDIAIAGDISLDHILYGLPETMPLVRELLARDFRLTLGSSPAIPSRPLTLVITSVLDALAAYLRDEPPDASAAFDNRTGARSTLRPGGTESFRDPGLVQEFVASAC